nr:MAG TPA: hypothetical protein [Caudoviricetes sp.]
MYERNCLSVIYHANKSLCQMAEGKGAVWKN